MKKLFIATLLSVSIAASAFAKDTKKVETIAVRAFGEEFSKAANVTWTATDAYVKATFTLNNEKMEAFYTKTGEKIGTSKPITLDELPVTTKRIFAKSFSGYTVKEAIEFEGTEESGYYISAENDQESVILKVNSVGGFSKYKVTKK